MKYLTSGLLILLLATNALAQEKSIREVLLLDTNWQFINRDVPEAAFPETNTSQWESVDCAARLGHQRAF
jgi:hypothetical protein